LILRRQGCEIYYYLTKQRHEVDFLARDYENKLTLYQVVWDINDKTTLDRELRALEEAQKELGAEVKCKLITPENYFEELNAERLG
jgi:predicted AAA+ superfamily ATPase